MKTEEQKKAHAAYMRTYFTLPENKAKKNARDRVYAAAHKAEKSAYDKSPARLAYSRSYEASHKVERYKMDDEDRRSNPLKEMLKNAKVRDGKGRANPTKASIDRHRFIYRVYEKQCGALLLEGKQHEG